MPDVDPWAGLVDPRAALAKAKQAAGTLARTTPHSSHAGYSENVIGSGTCDSFSHSSRGVVPPKPASHDSRKEEIDLSSSISRGYPISASSAGLPDPDPDRLGDRAPAKPAKRLNQGLSHSDHSILDLATPARAFAVTNMVPGPSAHLQGPLEWRDGLSRLDRYRPPCEGFRSGEWDIIHRVIGHFMDHCADEAAARGWRAINLFGVHRAAGAVAVDSCGALMLPGGGHATLITPDAIAFGPLVYRRRAMPEAVLAWNYQSAMEK